MAWDINNATYNSISFDGSGQFGAGYGLFFKPDGTKLYVCDSGGSVYQYSLSTPFDLSTMSYDSLSKNVTAQEGQPRGVFFKADGLKMYVVGSTGDAIWQYTLSTAWNVSTATYASKTVSVATQETVPTGISMKDDGTKVYISGASSDKVHQYTMSTPWDISTATYDTVALDLSGQSAISRGMFIGDSGSKLFIIDFNSGLTTSTVYRYNLSTPWDLSTASYASLSYAITQDTNSVGLAFNNDGTKMYVCGSTDDDIYEYTMSAATSIKNMNALAYASVKNKNGLAVASIKNANALV